MPQNKKNIVVKEGFIEDTGIYERVHIRNIRLIKTAIAFLFVGIFSGVMVVLDRNIFYTLISIVTLLISIFQFYKSFRNNENIFYHPDMRHLLRWGEDYPIILNLMEKDFQKDEYLNYGKFYISDQFIYKPTFYRFQWIHMSEIIWVFKRVTQHYTYFIPTNKDEDVIIQNLSGSVVIIRSDDVDEVITEIMKRAPYAYFGYTEEMKAEFNREPAKYINNVNIRRNQYYKNPIRFLKENYNINIKEEQKSKRKVLKKPKKKN